LYRSKSESSSLIISGSRNSITGIRNKTSRSTNMRELHGDTIRGAVEAGAGPIAGVRAAIEDCLSQVC
jgi:hypothetical protein